MLYRIEMNIVHMPRVIPVIADRMLPKPALPDAPLALHPTNRRQTLTSRKRPRKGHFDFLPSSREIGVLRRQCPDAMQMIGQYNPGIDMEGPTTTNAPYCIAKFFDVTGQKFAAALQQVDGKKIGTARDTVAAIVWHGRLDCPKAIRRKALRFSALRKHQHRYSAGASRKYTGRSIVGGRAGTWKNKSAAKPRW